MFQTKSNSSYINISKNAAQVTASKANNFSSSNSNKLFHGINLNKKTNRGFSASNTIKFKSRFTFTNQSPKIASGKIRNVFHQTQRPLFSLLDINDKKTNARGTSMPMQFIRRTNDEIIKILNIKIKPSSTGIKKEEAKESIKLMQDQAKVQTPLDISEEKPQSEAVVTPVEIVHNKEQQLPNKQLPLQSLPSSQSQVGNSNSNSNDNDNTNNKSIQEKQLTYTHIKPKTAIPNQRVAIVSIDSPNTTINQNRLPTRNDKWKPANYSSYELLVKNPELMKKEVILNTFARKLPNISIKEIRDKSRKSDIFFTQPKEDNYYEKAQCYTDFQNSDIFLLKNDAFSQSKSGERNMIIKDTRAETYTVSKKSNSEWHAKNSMPTLLNHNSTEWNLTNPDIKGIGKTKTEIVKECKERDEHFNPIYRQKSLCEFIDLTRNGAPNPNRDYLSSLNKTITCFNRRSDVCSTYNDIYGAYRDLCDKPFSKPKLI